MSEHPHPAIDVSATLSDGLRKLSIPQPEQAQRLLELYVEEIERWNPRFGLVKAASPQELIIKHVLDSLAPWRLVRETAQGGPVLDVGSGAGLPGIPLAICLPEIAFTLLERSARRVSFLRTCKALLELGGVKVIEGDLKSIDTSFDVVTFRAVAPLSRFFADAGRCGLRFRAVVAYKGRIERAHAEIEDVRRLAGERYRGEVVPVRVPFLNEERCVVIFRS